MISSTAKYALRAVVYLAGQADAWSSRDAIAEGTCVPRDYLLKVLNGLDEAGIVGSRRGPGGGYRLTRGPKEITARQVVLAVDEIPRIKNCPLGIPGHERLCRLHQLLDDASRQLEEALESATIAELATGRRHSSSCQFPKTTATE